MPSEHEARTGMAAVQCGLDMLPNSFVPVRAVPADVIVVPVTDFMKDGSDQLRDWKGKDIVVLCSAVGCLQLVICHSRRAKAYVLTGY